MEEVHSGRCHICNKKMIIEGVLIQLKLYRLEKYLLYIWRVKKNYYNLRIFVVWFVPCHIPDTGLQGSKRKKIERKGKKFGCA